jgi:hypothetical protein
VSPCGEACVSVSRLDKSTEDTAERGAVDRFTVELEEKDAPRLSVLNKFKRGLTGWKRWELPAVWDLFLGQFIKIKVSGGPREGNVFKFNVFGDVPTEFFSQKV